MFTLLHQTRNNFIRLVESLSIEQLNIIPDGFSNNIAWNFGHVVAAQQLLCYGLSGLPTRVDAAIIDLYKKGTKPETPVTAEAIIILKKEIISNIDALQDDLTANVFITYKPYTTSFGFTLNNIHDAVHFVSVHDGLHFGYAMAIRKALRIQ